MVELRITNHVGVSRTAPVKPDTPMHELLEFAEEVYRHGYLVTSVAILIDGGVFREFGE